MGNPELSVYNRESRIEKLEERLVDIALSSIFKLSDTDETTNWAEETLATFNSLPKANSYERKKVKNLITQTATRLLQNPQDLDIASAVWKTQSSQEDSGNSAGFLELVKTKSVESIKKNWEDVTSEQLADLIRIYTNSPSAQDFAKEMLGSYFKGPRNLHQRIDAYYNLVSATLDLVGEDEAFEEGMKIALHATDTLPKHPSLVEQTGLLSLPYEEAESVFKKLLIARCVVNQVRFIGSWGLDKYYEDRGNFILTDGIAIKEGNKRQRNATEKIGENEAKEMYHAMQYTMKLFSRSSIESLSEKRKQSLRMTWPFHLVFDETDPLNKKFHEVSLKRVGSTRA